MDVNTIITRNIYEDGRKNNYYAKYLQDNVFTDVSARDRRESVKR